MTIKTRNSKGFALYLLPSICLIDYGVAKEIKLSFLCWHLTIEWLEKKKGE
jgi:hypothetical protein